MRQLHYIIGFVKTNVGDIPRVSAKLQLRDHLGTIMVRWSVNRAKYSVLPGLYAVGNPSPLSDVFVTANYKLSFDHLRKNLDGIDAWILVLDTKGINVWCAAGKRTFSTKELVYRINNSRLEEIVSHRRIILPQLAATGVSAHEVTKLTERSDAGKFVRGFTHSAPSDIDFSPENTKVIRGFHVVYGPVKARHIKEFIHNKYVATKEMRRVTFTFPERAILIPNDFVNGLTKLLIAFALIFLLSGIHSRGYSIQMAFERGPGAIINIFLAYLAGIFITPLALPYIPVRSFAFKGFISGAALFLVLMFFKHPAPHLPEALTWFMIITAISSFTAMNFTGSSTYTSLSGVKKEMRIALTLQITSAVIGSILFVIQKFI